MPWIGKYWSSRIDRRERPAVLARSRRSPPRVRNTGAQRSTSPTWCGTRSSERRDPGRRREVGRRAASRRTPAGPRSAAASTAARCAAVHVHTHTDVDPVEQLGDRVAPVRRRDGGRRSAARSGSASYVAVERGVDQADRRRAAATTYACTVPMWPHPDQTDPDHRPAPSFVDRAIAGPTDSRPEPIPHLVDRALDRARGARRARVGRRRPRRRGRACPARPRRASSCDSETPSRRTPRSTSNSASSSRAASSEHRAHVGRHSEAFGSVCGSRSRRSGSSA